MWWTAKFGLHYKGLEFFILQSRNFDARRGRTIIAQLFSWKAGKPIWCAKSVRFRLGHPKSLRDKRDLLNWSREQPADHKFIWTYTSQEFPMRQIELLGIAMRCDLDDLFYICVRHVRVVGRPLRPEFDVEVLDPSQELVLKYNRDVFRLMLRSFSME
ncbi:hypothetical protein HAX54_045423, partial [Datura stramonium]|nr:hypothetical protein [Datura stramonium]